MTQDLKCKLGMHKYEVLSQHPKTDTKGNEIGVVIISRCVNCGKVTQTTVMFEEGHREM